MTYNDGVKVIRADGKVVRGKAKAPKRRLMNHACPICQKPCGAAAACDEHKVAVRLGVPSFDTRPISEQLAEVRTLDKQADEARQHLDNLCEDLAVKYWKMK